MNETIKLDGWKPVGPTLLIKGPVLEEKSKGGIILTKTETEKNALTCEKGSVVALSDLAFKDMFDGTPWCKPGDEVMFTKFAGKDIMVEEEDGTERVYRLIKDVDVHLVKPGN